MSAERILTTHKCDAFDPEEYISTYYPTIAGNKEEGDILKFFLDGLHEAFTSGAITGIKLLDIGTGPFPHTAFCAAPWFEEITLTDFSQTNLEFLRKWKDGQINHMRPILEYLVQLDKSRSLEEWQDELRRKIKHIIMCDIHQPNPIASTPVDGVVFDVITSANCLEVASYTLDDYAKSVRNISGLLKPGGHLILLGVLEQTFYTVGDLNFKCTPINKYQLEDIFQKEGFEILSLKDITTENYAPSTASVYSDFKNACIMVAKKAEHQG